MVLAHFRYQTIVAVTLRRQRFMCFLERTSSSHFRMAHTKSNIYVTRCDMPGIGIELLKTKYNVTVWTEASTVPRDILLKNVVGINGLFCTLSDKINAELLDKAGPELKVVSTISVGYDHIDLEECKRRGIKVGYTPDVLTDATAELTMGLLLCTSRRLLEAHNEAVIGHWTAWSPNWMTGPGLADSVVGIVGFGRIGEAVAKRIKSFGPRKILYNNRSDKTDIAKLYDAESADLFKIASDSDFVISCCALNDYTKGIFNNNFFSKMKKTAIFINTSRGGLVDQDALIEALQSGRIRAAGLDVTNPEPLPTDNVLFKLPNCVVLPHIGSASIEARARMSELTAHNIIAALNGEKMSAELV